MSQVRVHNFSVSLDGFGTGRNAARERLAALLRDAVVPPLARRATRPTSSSWPCRRWPNSACTSRWACS